MVATQAARPDEDNFDPRTVVFALWRRRYVILLTVLATVGSALAASFLQTPVYGTSAELLLQSPEINRLIDPNSGQRTDPARNIRNEIRILQAQPVKDEVEKRLGTAPPVSVSAVGDTDLIQIRAESTDPARAALVANTYADAYVDLRRTTSVNSLLEAAQEIQRRIDDLQADINAAPEGDQRDSLVAQQGVFRQRLEELEVQRQLQSGGAQLVTEADVPTSPFKPTPIRNGIVSMILGLMFGMGAALLLEYLDDSIHTKEEINELAPHAPVLAMIPTVDDWRNDRPYVVTLRSPSSPTAEAYRGLRTSIQFASLERDIRTIQVTSPIASEGKTTTVSNLAVTLGDAGQRVIVVDCDFRRPRLHSFFALSNDRGFTSVLLGHQPLSACIQRPPNVSRVMILPSGPLPPNPSELLSSSRTEALLKTLQAEADVVLIDSPPVLPVTDAAVLATRVDGTVVIVGPSSTKSQLRTTIENLTRVNAPLIGTVMNGVDASFGYGYGYGYGYGGYGRYGQTPEAEPIATII